MGGLLLVARVYTRGWVLRAVCNWPSKPCVTSIVFCLLYCQGVLLPCPVVSRCCGLAKGYRTLRCFMVKLFVDFGAMACSMGWRQPGWEAATILGVGLLGRALWWQEEKDVQKNSEVWSRGKSWIIQMKTCSSEGGEEVLLTSPYEIIFNCG